MILFTVSKSPLTQLRILFFGQLISAFIGIAFLKLFGNSILVTVLATECAVVMMQFLRCIHPPASANPLAILLTSNHVHYDFSFLLFPVLSGSIVLVIVAYVVINNSLRGTKWSVYWLAMFSTKKISLAIPIKI
ncbi:hypothetical protein DKL61_01215 [Gammaproteobacteria bacterium ESL0073]|nr:hypothetical protein DKL61_01215 [Gammaproteobacteria bacterium ESL0073]